MDDEMDTRLADLEDAFEELKAEFEEIQSDHDDMEDEDSAISDMDYESDDMDDMDDMDDDGKLTESDLNKVAVKHNKPVKSHSPSLDKPSMKTGGEPHKITGKGKSGYSMEKGPKAKEFGIKDKVEKSSKGMMKKV